LGIEKPLGCDACDLQNTVAEDTLVGQVVDGEDRCCVGEVWVIAVERLEPIGYDTGMPVVTVEDVGRPRDGAGVFEGGAAEEDEALTIVGIAVELFAQEGARRIHEEKTDAVTDWRLQHIYRHDLLVNGYWHAGHCGP